MKLIPLISAVFFCWFCAVAEAESIISSSSNKDLALKAIIFQIPCLRWHHSGRCIRGEYSRSVRKSLKENVLQLKFGDVKEKFKNRA